MTPLVTEVHVCGRTLRYRRHEVVTPDGLRVCAQDWDRRDQANSGGRDVLLIHGFAQSHLCWINQVTGQLANQHRLVTWDLRGHGGSDKPLDPACYREPSRWAGEVAAVIAATGLIKPVLVAWSYGGRVALDYLLTTGGDAISGLVMVAGTSSASPSVLGPATSALRHMAQAVDLGDNLAATCQLLDICCAIHLPDADRALMLAYNMMVPIEVRAAMSGREAQYEPLLRSLACPVLAIHGALDRINLPAMAHYTAGICLDGESLIYEGVGHAPFLEAPSRFDADLASYLARE